VVGLQNVQAEDFGFGIEERETDEVEGDQALEARLRSAKGWTSWRWDAMDSATSSSAS
jgi:hypothetical protein